MTIYDEYIARCAQPSDINQLLPILYSYAQRVYDVVEFGVREGNSTIALAAAYPMQFTAYDVNLPPAPLLDMLNNVAGFTFVQQDVLTVKLDPVDMLFIDTLHTYKQLRAELKLARHKVGRYILMHDTTTFGEVGEDGGAGLNKAIDEFLAEAPEWHVLETFDYNNGLTVLEFFK